MSVKALFHVNHLWGLGHFSRVALIADAVVEAGGEATILSGGPPAHARLSPLVRLVALPMLRSPDTSYALLVDENGDAPGEALWAARAAIIDRTLAEAAPDIIVTETFPFGRRKFGAELLRLVAAAKTRGAAIVASVRDLPNPPADARRLDECAARLLKFYDAAAIHADPMIVGLNEVWPGEIPCPCHMTGYVAAPSAPPAGAHQGVVVSAGGGGDAAPVLRIAATARKAGLLADEPWTFVTGRAAHDALADELRVLLRPGDALLRHADDLPARIAAARLSISRGGYNTTLEAVAAGTPAVIVPFAPPGEPEQGVRARLFAAAGLVSHLPEAELTPQALAGAAADALARPAPAPDALDLNGAAATAALLARIAGGG